MLKVELLYIAADASVLHLNLSLPFGACVADALNHSGVLKSYPELQGLPIGIFAKQVTLDTLLKPGDRIEIYRPLTFDPKEKRRQRAKVKKENK